MLLMLLSWLGSRGKDATPAHTLSQQERSHMRGRLRLRYEQMRIFRENDSRSEDVSLESERWSALAH